MPVRLWNMTGPWQGWRDTGCPSCALGQILVPQCAHRGKGTSMAVTEKAGRARACV